jgi:Uma2 family endonuclease
MLALEDNRFVTSASWDEYSKFLAAVGDRPIRVTYDRGRLEIMSPSPAHEKAKKLLATLLESILADWDQDYEALGSMTFRREDLDRGLEPDECYWFKKTLAVRDLEEFDFTRDPAPELVIEVEITSSVINRLGLFHALGVDEVWSLTRKGELLVLSWQEDGYHESPVSRVLAGFPAPQMVRWLQPGELTRPQLVRACVQWARPFNAAGR